MLYLGRKKRNNYYKISGMGQSVKIGLFFFVLGLYIQSYSINLGC